MQTMNCKLAFCGHGRAGKDTAGAWLHLHTPLLYAGSLSSIVCEAIAKDLDIPVNEAWTNRHKHRQYWYEWCNNLRKDDASKLIKMSLSRGNLVVGIRDVLELKAAIDQRLLNLIVWVKKDVPVDPTVTYQESDCDVTICNTSTYDRYYAKLAKLCDSLRIPIHNCSNCNDPIYCQAVPKDFSSIEEVTAFIKSK